MGAVFYRGLYAIAGFYPMPFHLACTAIALFNLYLTYCVVRRLAESRELALLATLISAYHARFADLYYNIGTIYDLLCFSFFYGAFLYYVRIRQSGKLLSARQIVVWCLLYVAALNSKEMAVALPVFIAAYEWFYHQRIAWREVPIFGVITVLSIVGKYRGPEHMTANPAYLPDISVRNYFDAFQIYSGKLFFREEWFDLRKGLALLVLLAGIAWLLKAPHLKLSFVIITCGILPVAFITHRGAFVLYMPMVGWAMYGATILVGARDAVLPSKPFVSQVVLFLAVMLLLGWIQRSRHDPKWLASSKDKIELIAESMRRVNPTLPKGAKVLFLNDPFEIDESWQMKGLLQLVYNDHDLDVQTLKRLNPHPDPAIFGYIFDNTSAGIVRIKPAR